MDVTTFIVTVFCLVDDWLASQPRPLRRRGPAPSLADSEVLTIECVGKFLGIDTDKGLYEHFRRHWAAWFPALGQVHRTTFVRQAANLWAVKHQLRRHLLTQVDLDPEISLIDSVAIPICRFARAYRCRRLRELAAWGHDEVAKQTYLGLRAHLRVCWPGVMWTATLPRLTSPTSQLERTCSPRWPGGCWPTAATAAPAWPSSCGRKGGGYWPRPEGLAGRGNGHRPG
jgi:hypothetical protein